jgi:hypothetical protein
VPHDVVEPKIGSKKKLVMQLDRDVQVCGIYFFCYSMYSLIEILLFYFGGGHASSLFSYAL